MVLSSSHIDHPNSEGFLAFWRTWAAVLTDRTVVQTYWGAARLRPVRKTKTHFNAGNDDNVIKTLSLSLDHDQ